MSHPSTPTRPFPAPGRAAGLTASLALVAALSGMATAPAFAVDCFDYSTSMHWIGGLRYPGDGLDIAVVGNRAYLTTYAPSLIALDISDPTSPILLGSVTAASVPASLAVQGNYAYVSCGSAGLQVFDISNPSAMHLVGSVVPSGVADGIAVSGTKAYVAYRTNGLYIFDLTNPVAPTLLGTLDTPGDARDVTVVGTRAYVADTNSGLRIVNVSNPAAPTSLGWVDTPNKAVAVRVAGTLAYVGDTTSLQVANVSNPASPSIVGAVSTQGTGACLAVSGADVFLSGTECIKAVDATNPGAPVVVGTMPDARSIAAIEVVGGIAYVAKGGSMPFSAFQVGSQSTPGPLAVYHSDGEMRSFEVEGSYGYLGLNAQFSAADFRVLDLSNPASPVEVASLNIQTVEDIAIDGSLGFAFSRATWEIIPIDLADPVHPVEYPAFLPSAFVNCIAADQPYLYMGDSTGNLWVADASNPNALSVVANVSITTGAFVRDLAISGHYLYAATGTHGTYVVDIANPLLPDVVAHLSDIDVERVDLKGQYLLRSRAGFGFAIDDMSNPEVPTALSELNGATWTNATAIDGDLAYMAGESNPGGLWIVDLSQPSSPQVIGSAMLPAVATEVVVARGAVYALCGTLGMVIMPAACPPNAAGVEGTASLSPTLQLTPAVPNPTHDRASLRLSLSRPARVTSTVFDASGRAVRLLLSSSMLAAGSSELSWDGRDAQGRPAAQGVYFVRVIAGTETAQSKLTLIR